MNVCLDVDDVYIKDDILEIDDELDVIDEMLKIKLDELEQNMHDEVGHEPNDVIDAMLLDVIDEHDEIDEIGQQQALPNDMHIYEQDEVDDDTDIVTDETDETDIMQV